MSTTTDEAAQLLLAAWTGTTRIDGLPLRCRPAHLDQGYAIQDALLIATGETLAGYKIAATSVAGSDMTMKSPFATVDPAEEPSDFVVALTAQ